MLRRWPVAGALAIATLIAAAPAQAAFPGANGQIAFIAWEEEAESYSICRLSGTSPTFQSCSSATEFDQDPAWSADGTKLAIGAVDVFGDYTNDVFRMNADGTGLTNLTNDEPYDDQPAWSPGGDYLAFYTERDGNGEIYSVDAGGGTTTNLTNHPAADFMAAPGPTGRIAFVSDRAGNSDVYVMDPDGGNVTPLTDDPAADYSPNWSPDGERIVFTSSRDGNSEIYVMDADGGNETRLTTTSAASEIGPAWSPDGQQIAYWEAPECFGCVDAGAINKVNADGTGRQTLFQGDGGLYTVIGGPDWQPLPANTASTHVRPAGATPLQVALVPAFSACTAPNRTHGPPLAFPSCNPPTGSPNLTVGVGDGDLALSRSVGSVRFGVLSGTPGGVDDTDVRVRFSLSNVMKVSDLSEYAGELDVRVGVRLTDREGTLAQTTGDFPLSFAVPCAPTPASTLDKSLCSTVTSFDAITPGSAAEGTRAVWGLGQVRVNDGGPDGDAHTRADNSPFAVQGVFVP